MSDYEKARERALQTFGTEGVAALDGIVTDMMPYVQKIIAEIGIDQVRANLEKGIAEIEVRRAQRLRQEPTP